MLVNDVKKRDGMKYEAMPVRKSKKSDIRIISEMSRLQILWHLIYRCRVGLLMTSTLGMAVYVTGLYKVLYVAVSMLF